MAGKSTYPAVIDVREPDPGYNANLRPLIDFEDRTDSSAVDDYTILAADIEFLQDAIMSIENELGVNPSWTDATVAARIENILDTTTADLRYGGSGWAGETILGHNHSGNKIDLTTDVTGELPAANINLGSAGALTAELIYLTESFVTTIGDALDAKMDSSGGTISGDLIVSGSVISNTMADIDAYIVKVIGTVIDDTGAYSESALEATVADDGGTLLTYTQQMRFFDYSCSIRCRVSDITKTDSICDIKIFSGSTEKLTYALIPNVFDANDTYKVLHFPFTHDDSSKNVTVRIDWFGATRQGGTVDCDLVVDSFLITPINNAAYWELT